MFEGKALPSTTSSFKQSLSHFSVQSSLLLVSQSYFESSQKPHISHPIDPYRTLNHIHTQRFSNPTSRTMSSSNNISDSACSTIRTRQDHPVPQQAIFPYSAKPGVARQFLAQPQSTRQTNKFYAKFLLGSQTQPVGHTDECNDSFC